MARRKAAAPEQGPSFEEAIARLEEIVRELEEADLPLDRSLAVFEEGVRLSRLLHDKLNAAERKVEILLKDGAGCATIAPFPGADAPADDCAAAADETDGGEDDDDEDDAGDDAGGRGRRGGGGGSGQTGFGF